MPLARDVDLIAEVGARAPPPAHARRERLAALRAEALVLVRELGLCEPRTVWRIVPLEGRPGPDGRLEVGGESLQAPWLVPASGQLTGLAIAVATLGARLEAQVRELFAQRRAALALALDGVGNELLFALTRRLQDRMLAVVRRQGLTMAGELRAGDPGLPLAAQQAVLRLAAAGDIGVTLTPTMMMRPAKSASIVQGVGLALPATNWSRCDTCASRPRCAVAREAA